MAKKILLVIAHEGYQPVEYGTPKQLFEDAGFEVITASDKPGIATAKDGSTTLVDLTLEEVDPQFYDGIFFIGGPGAMEHLDNADSYELLKLAEVNKIPFGAICISVRILAKAGVLDGKMVTGWNEDGELPDILSENGAQYAPVDVLVESNTVTAVGPKQAADFAHKIIDLLKELDKGL